MKELLKKSWFTGLVSLGLVLAIYFINLWIMSIELTWPFDGDNFLQLPLFQFDEGAEYIFAFILKILFFALLVPVVFAGISFFRKKNWGFVLAASLDLGLQSL